jgi:hypothetical protein
MRDVRAGYVSPAAARDAYGVVIADGAVDAAATTALRAELRSQRPVLSAVAWAPRSEAQSPTQRFGAGRETLTRLAVQDGDLVEIGTAAGAPVRGRLCLAEQLATDAIGVEPMTLDVLALKPGDAVWMRPVTTPTADWLR